MFISLAERDDFQQLGQDSEFQNAWKQRAPIGNLVNDAQFKSLWQNQDTANLVWGIIQDRFEDLVRDLRNRAVREVRFGKNCRPLGFQRRRDHRQTAGVPDRSFRRAKCGAVRLVTQSYAKTAFVAGADGQAFMKNLPSCENAAGTAADHRNRLVGG